MVITKAMEEAFREGARDVWGEDPPPWAPDWARKGKKGRKSPGQGPVFKKVKKGKKKRKKPKTIKLGHIEHTPIR